MNKKIPYYPESLKHNMALLLLWDFFSRYWWTVPIILLVSWFVSQINEIAVIAYLALISLVGGATALVGMERLRGVMTIYKTLPLPRSLSASILWFEGVLLFPLIFLICSFLILPFVWIFGGIGFSPTLHNIVMYNLLVVNLGAGYASILIYSILLLNTREHMFTLGTTAILLMYGFMFIARVHVFAVEHYDLWAIGVMGLCPIIILLSYFFRSLLQHSYVVLRKQSKKTPPRYFRSPASFLFHFWARQMGMLLLALLACVGLSVISRLVKGMDNLLVGAPFLFMFFLALMVPALSVARLGEIGALRALPMTAGRLSIFLLSIPVINALCATVLCTLLFLVIETTDGLWYVPAAGCFSIGLSIILYNVALLFGPIAIILGSLLLLPSFMFLGYELLFMIPVVGLAISPLLMYQIKYSSEVYHRRSLGGSYISDRR